MFAGDEGVQEGCGKFLVRILIVDNVVILLAAIIAILNGAQMPVAILALWQVSKKNYDINLYT